MRNEHLAAHYYTVYCGITLIILFKSYTVYTFFLKEHLHKYMNEQQHSVSNEQQKQKEE